MLVDIIDNFSFIDNRIAEHVTALLLLWVGQKMSIFWRQGKSSQGVVAICVVDPQGIFHTCTLGAVGRVSEGPVVVASDGVVRARHAVCSVVVSARFFLLYACSLPTTECLRLTSVTDQAQTNLFYPGDRI